MIPFGIHTATLFHRQRIETDGRAGEEWTKQLLSGCSWRERVISYAAATEVVRSAETVCRIPPDQPKPAVGDVLVKGDCADIVNTAADAARLIDRYGYDSAFRVSSVADNTGAHLPHWTARGG